MNHECGQEEGPILVGFKDRHGRSVSFQCTDDLLKAGVATFGQMQLLQELTDPAVAVAAAGCPVVLQSLDADGTIRTGMAENLNSVWQNTHLDILEGGYAYEAKKRKYPTPNHPVHECAGGGII